MYKYRLNEQHLFMKDKLNKSKEGLSKYNFSSGDGNNSSISQDYAGYVLNIRFECEVIRDCITEMSEYEKYGEKLLYSQEDVPLLVEYMEYISNLIMICNSIVDHVFNTKHLVLKHSMTKKDTIRIALEQQRYLLEAYNDLFKVVKPYL